MTTMPTEANTVLSDEDVEQAILDFGEDAMRAARHIPALCRTIQALRAEIVTGDQEWQARLAEVERELKATKQHRDDLIAELGALK